MSKKEDAFLQELLAAFRTEAEEHLALIAAGLWELEKNPDDPHRASVLESIYRDAHSLKGAARSVNINEIEAVCQSLENVFSMLKQGALRLAAGQFDTLNHTVDVIRRIVKGEDVRGGDPAGLIRQLEDIAAGSAKLPAAAPVPEHPAGHAITPPTVKEPAAPAPVPPGPAAEAHSRPAAGTESVRIAVGKLDALFFQVEEMLAVKQAVAQRASVLREIELSFDQWKAEWSKAVSRLLAVRPHAGGKEQPASRQPEKNVADVLEWQSARMKAMAESVRRVTQQADEDQRTTGRMINELLEDVKKVIMLPASRVLHSYPKIIRDLGRSQGKEAEAVVEGGEIEMDKRIIEEMKDPLMHLVRNCVDHGLETPAERRSRGKPPAGSVKVSLSHLDSNHVQIVIADDGAGIDAAALKAAAVKAGILAPAEAGRLSSDEALMLMFQSAVSTSSKVSKLSGRGLGLAIVREKVDQLGGRVAVDTRPGQGTTFRIVLPLTMATFRGVLIEVSERVFVIPATNVERVIRVRPEEIKTVENRETIHFNGQALALVRLQAILELPALAAAETKAFPAVVLAAAERRLAFGVDRVLEENEVLVKGLGKQLARVRNVGGATVLASGAVVPILNVADLMQSAVRSSGPGAAPAVLAAPELAAAPAVLLAEDSVTSRMLLKNILQSSGYRVRAAVDGAEAWTLLRTEPFDAVVSDVEMPRMDGFDLTARIRADAKLADLPVILVTARASREDREHGIDVGASAYLVKSSFDQSNLLEVLKSLL